MAQSFEEELALADVYAEALFALAREADRVTDVRDELEELARLVAAEPGFAALLRSAAVDADDRRASLERALRGKLSDMTLNTLQVMNDHGRVHLVEPLRRAFELRAQQAARQVEVTATSAVALTPEQQAEVTKLAAALAGQEPLVRYEIDAHIIGGLVLRVGDQRYDSSIRRKLEQARQRLAERGSAGLPATARQR